MVVLISNRWPLTFIECLQQVQAIYLQRGFVIHAVLADSEFEVVQPAITKMGIGSKLHC